MSITIIPDCKCSLRTSLVGDGCAVCNPKLAAEIDAENAAEERLRDAAPDLLAALQYARRNVKASECDIAFIDAAIAKASPC